MDRATRFMNERQYSEAINILEGIYAENPNNSQTALLLAQAHLGNAHFEMMDLIGKVSGRQDPIPADTYWVVQPKCDDGPIEKIAGYDIRCILFRLMNHLPDAEDPSLIRARNILRTTFKDPSQTASDVNFLSAVVEFNSALFRLRNLGTSKAKELLDHEPTNQAMADAQFKLVSHNVKRFIVEIFLGFKRLRYSYGKLANFIRNLDGKPMITIGDQTLIFSDNLDTKDILRFAALIVHDRAQGVDDQLSYLAQRQIQIVGMKYSSQLAKFDRSFFSRDQLENLSIYWRFNHAISQIFDEIAEIDTRDNQFKPATLLWENPPILFREFRDSIEQGWSQEAATPVWDYFLRTKDRWNELGQILDAWAYWFDQGLSRAQQTEIRSFIRRTIKEDPRFSNLPERIRTESIEKYGRDMTNALMEKLKAIFSGQTQEIPSLTQEQIESGDAILRRTEKWIDQNLWVIDPGT
jgi:hypothetical protein